LKQGAVAIAMDAGNIPIVPIVVGNAAHVFNMPKRSFHHGTIRVKIHPSICTEIKEAEDRDTAISRILSEMREVIIDTLSEISISKNRK
jgi:1-acyl-sn-glycerol-3-phosphate acyltransferase